MTLRSNPTRDTSPTWAITQRVIIFLWHYLSSMDYHQSSFKLLIGSLFFCPYRSWCSGFKLSSNFLRIEPPLEALDCENWDLIDECHVQTLCWYIHTLDLSARPDLLVETSQVSSLWLIFDGCRVTQAVVSDSSQALHWFLVMDVSESFSFKLSLKTFLSFSTSNLNRLDNLPL